MSHYITKLVEIDGEAVLIIPDEITRDLNITDETKAFIGPVGNTFKDGLEVIFSPPADISTIDIAKP